MEQAEAYALISALVAFAISLTLTGRWVHIAELMGFTAKDMNKPGDVKAARAGGVWSVVAVAFGLLTLSMLNTYLGESCGPTDAILALSLQLVLAAFLGLVDDLLGWKKGLRAIYRVILMAPLSIPMVVIKAGVSTVDLPVLGKVDLGLAYPLLLVPIGILGAANAFNMLAGYNGLEASMGALLLSFAAVYASMKGLCLPAAAALIGAAGIVGFLVYNLYPARAFPGNAFTYAVGAYYASVVILGNFEKFGVTLFALYFAEFALFVRGRLNGVYKENFGIPRQDGTLAPPYEGRVYSVTHLALLILDKLTGHKVREPQVVAFIVALQIVVGIIALIVYL